MKFNFIQLKIFRIALILAFLFALGSLFFRYRVEKRNLAVQICMEMQHLKPYAKGQYALLSTLLLREKQYGLGAVVLSEETLLDAIQVGKISLLQKHFLVGSKDELLRAKFGLEAYYQRAFTLESLETGDFRLDLGQVDLDSLRYVSIGLDPKDCRLLRDHKLAIIARHQNQRGYTPETVLLILKRSKNLGADLFLPEGDQVLGYLHGLESAQSALSELRMFLAVPEFVKMAGMKKLSREMPDRVINLHSISLSEINQMTPSEMRTRFIKAARERNVRLLLVRPKGMILKSLCHDSILSEFNLAGALNRVGLQVKQAKPFEEPGVPRVFFLLLGISVTAVAYLVLTQFIRSRSFSVLLSIVLGAMAFLAWEPLGRSWLALLSAIVFPVAGFMSLNLEQGRPPWRNYLYVSFISLAGGLVVAALLNELNYIAHVETLKGVKLAQLVPILLISMLLFYHKIEFRKILRSPIHWGAGFTGVLLLAIVMLMLVRSGNDSPAAVSGIELKFRGLFDALFYVRPRTKEFLFGHPFLWTGFALLPWISSMKECAPQLVLSRWTMGFVSLGIIGQVSIVNTFCHLHTPLLLSLARVATGLIFGAAFGIVLTLIIKKLFLRISNESH